jgi:hypothetical protein
VPIIEFYREVWDAPLAGAAVVDIVRNPDWHWFKEIKNPNKYGGFLCGVVPLSGILFSREVLEIIARQADDPLYKPLISECRIGTLAKRAGYQPRQISSNAADYITWSPRTPTHPGIWHPVKSIFSSQRF